MLTQFGECFNPLGQTNSRAAAERPDVEISRHAAGYRNIPPCGGIFQEKSFI